MTDDDSPVYYCMLTITNDGKTTTTLEGPGRVTDYRQDVLFVKLFGPVKRHQMYSWLNNERPGVIARNLLLQNDLEYMQNVLAPSIYDAEATRLVIHELTSGPGTTYKSIQAIKALRTYSPGLGLKDAKDRVDTIRLRLIEACLLDK